MRRPVAAAQATQSFAYEANAMIGRISDQSPMGAAMMHAHEGDEVSFDSPAGVLKFKILSVTRTK